MNSIIKRLLLSAVSAGALFAFAGTAAASHAMLEVKAVGPLTVGDTVDLRADLHAVDTGEPVVGATVTFYMEASFGGVDGEALLGQAVTGSDGVAVLPFTPRAAGEHQLRVEYLTPDTGEPEEVMWSHTVDGTTGQLYRSTAGVHIPQLNSWLLMALVGTVWAVLLSIALRVVAIAHAGGGHLVIAQVQRAARSAVSETDAGRGT